MKKLSLLVLFSILALTFISQSAWSADRRISIATAGVGGTYYQIGAALANVLSDHMPGIQATTVTSAGAVENVRLLGKKQADMAFTMALLNDKAIKGNRPFKKVIRVSPIATLYPNVALMVTLKGSGIEGYRQGCLAGTRRSGEYGLGRVVARLRIIIGHGYDHRRGMAAALAVADG